MYHSCSGAVHHVPGAAEDGAGYREVIGDGDEHTVISIIVNTFLATNSRDEMLIIMLEINIVHRMMIDLYVALIQVLK